MAAGRIHLADGLLAALNGSQVREHVPTRGLGSVHLGLGESRKIPPFGATRTAE